ncbi:MAG: hypothetical protein US52_C0014G0001, partial [candidate division WS6 bacterium GW2011_GWA2_37_6]
YSGLSDVIFEKLSGNTLNSGILTISNNTKTVNLTINDKGSVLY